MAKRKNVVWLQSWEESEAGWGQRPDGYSLHLTHKAAKKYGSEFMKAQAERLGKAVPSEYDRPCGQPYRVHVTAKILAEIRKGRPRHLRVWSNKDQPWPVVADERSGWAPMKK